MSEGQRPFEVVDDLIFGLERIRAVIGGSDLDRGLFARHGRRDPIDVGRNVPDLQRVGPNTGERAGAGGREIVLVGRHFLSQAQDLPLHGRNLVIENFADSFGPKHGGTD